MKSFAILAFVFLVTICDLYGLKPVQGHGCECTHHLGGCVISKASSAGFKCRCAYMGFWACSGIDFPCVGNERCPGNLSDPCACQLGRGNCGGYYTDPRSNCAISASARPHVADSANCDCVYSYGGCSIKTPAPYGWKCVCVYKGFWTCKGWAQQCYHNEICLGGDRSYCACKQGRGNCGGYPDRPRCSPTIASETCDCNRGSDWSKGHYIVESVQYDTSSTKIQHINLKVLALKGIPNFTGVTQTVGFSYGETVKLASSFEYTRGIEIGIGTKFSVDIPSVITFGLTNNIATSKSHTWGKSESTEKMFQGHYTCNGKAYKYTQCSAAVWKAQVSVPYVMQVKHKQIQDCVCESYGVWKGTWLYNFHLAAKELGDCLDESCGNVFGHEASFQSALEHIKKYVHLSKGPTVRGGP